MPTWYNKTQSDTLLAAKDAAGAAAAAQTAAVAAAATAAAAASKSADTIVDGTTNKAYTAAERTKLAGLTQGGGAAGPNLTDIGYDLIILAGQSNMVGINSGGGSIDTVHYDAADPRVWVYNPYNINYQGISLGLDPLQQSGTSYGVGPGMPFARWYSGLVPTNRKVLLVPVAAGGTSLGGTVVPRWHPNLAGSLYDTMVSVTQSALTAAGPNARVAAILWGQGENDGDAGRTQAQYAADLTAFVDAARTSFGNQNLPFAIIGMTPEGIASSTGRTAVDAAQRALPAARTYTSFTAGVTGQSDGTHYTIVGQRANGVNLARGYATATTNTTAPASTYPYTAPRTPAQVGTVTVTPGNGQLALSWAAPAANGATITSYEITYTPAGGSATVTETGTTATTATITGLTNGTAYTVSVAGTNSVGTGLASGNATGTPAGAGATVPGAPTGLTATAAAASTALSWTAPASNGGAAISNYLVEYQPSGGSWTTFTHTASASTSITVTGLTNGTVYLFRVSAINSAGTGTASGTATATPAAGGSTTTETWTGTNGAAWPAAWTTGGICTIQNNMGDMTTSSYYASAVRSGMTGVTGDFDLTLTWAISGQTGNTTVFFGVSDQLYSAGSASPFNGYAFAPIAIANGSVGGLAISRYNGGTGTVLAQSYPSVSPGVGGFKTRVQRVGATINAKIWAADATEPGTWTLTATDSSPLSVVEKVFIGTGGDTATHMTVDNLTANWV